MAALTPDMVGRLPAGGASAAERIRAGTVVVLGGGSSSEREISLASARAVLRSLITPVDAHDRRGPARVLACELDERGRWLLDGEALAPTTALERLPAEALLFVALHGGAGENGVLQGFLELAGRAYTGSGVAASALCMDKFRARAVLASEGLGLAPGWLVRRAASEAERAGACARLAPQAGAGLVVKPNAGGSSVGVERVASAAELEAALARVLAVDDALVEGLVRGIELSCGVLGEGESARALPPIEIVPAEGAFFDYRQKYAADGARELCPPRSLSAAQEARVRAAALAAHRACGCAGASRTDLILPADRDEPVVLEVNTLPGLTERSLLPQEAAALGADHRELCLALCGLAWARFERERGARA